MPPKDGSKANTRNVSCMSNIYLRQWAMSNVILVTRIKKHCHKHKANHSPAGDKQTYQLQKKYISSTAIWKRYLL